MVGVEGWRDRDPRDPAHAGGRGRRDRDPYFPEYFTTLPHFSDATAAEHETPTTIDHLGDRADANVSG